MNTEDRIRQLEQEVAALKSLLPQTSDSRPVVVSVGAADGTFNDIDSDERSSRRSMLRLAGAGAIGAVGAALVGVQSAAAANGISLLGASNTTPNLTEIAYTGSTGGDAFLFSAPAVTGGTSGVFFGVVTGRSNTLTVPNGVSGATAVSGSAGVVGEATAIGSVGVLGLTATVNSIGVQGQSSGNIGVAVQGQSFGPGSIGGSFLGVTAGVTSSSSTGLGGSFSGGLAALKVASSNPAPRARANAHARGEIDTDTNGDLWLCTVAGSPGTWRKIAGPASAGAYHAVSPGRVYDSRLHALNHAPISNTNGPYTLGTSARADALTGVYVQSNFVPPGSTAITANVTITGTTGSGFLVVNPGGVGTVNASTINWFGAGQTLANGVSLTLGGDRQLTVVLGGVGSTHFIIDVTGYYL